MTDIKTNEKRRKVLKTAGVATVAAGAWHKPVLNSVITPAHAQTSAPAVMISGAGASSSTPPIAILNKNTNDSLVDNAIDALLPSAHAGVEAGGLLRTCPALIDPFSSKDSDNTHCVSLMFPNGTDRNGDVMVSVMGPTLYYDRQCFYYTDEANYQGATQSYAGSLTAGGSDTVTMNDGNFMVTLNNVNVFGSIDADFDNATGTLIYTGPDEQIEVGGMGYACTPNAAEGAYWAAELGESGGSCTPGLGAEGGARLIAINSAVCDNPA